MHTTNKHRVHFLNCQGEEFIITKLGKMKFLGIGTRGRENQTDNVALDCTIALS